jgi:hypothetical protein
MAPSPGKQEITALFKKGAGEGVQAALPLDRVNRWQQAARRDRRPGAHDGVE